MTSSENGKPPTGFPILVVFAPSRSRIARVNVRGVPLQALDGHFGFVWHGVSRHPVAKNEKCNVQFKGDVPRRLGFDVGELAPARNDRKGIANYVNGAFTNLLERCVNLERGDLWNARRFFFRYDAWSQPLIAKVLIDPQFKDGLTKDAAELFYTGMTGVYDAPYDLYEPTAKDLATLFKRRAHDYHVGERQPDVLKYVQDRTAFLGNVTAIAQFQERLFESGFPGCLDVESDAFRNLCEVFVKFALGELHFEAPPAETVPPNDPLKGVAPLNAEPDSIMFLAFAELAIHASRLRSRQCEFWFALARTFAGLVEPFTRVYGDARYRGPAHYAPAFRRDGRVAREDVDARLGALAERMPNSSALASQLEPFFAAAALAAMYDEVSRPFSTGKRLLSALFGPGGGGGPNGGPVLPPIEEPRLAEVEISSTGETRSTSTVDSKRFQDATRDTEPSTVPI